MNDKELREIIFKSYKRLAELRISDFEHDMLSMIRRQGKRGTYTSAIAAQFGISVQNAGARLHTLRRKGYLTRVAESAPSGGTEYRYTYAEPPKSKASALREENEGLRNKIAHLEAPYDL